MKMISAQFTSPNHNDLEDVKIFILAFIKTPCTSPISKTPRLHEEALWQHRLHSLAPHGFVCFIECFTTTFLPTHSWLNWVDADDDEDEVGLKEKPEDTSLAPNGLNTLDENRAQ